jgi:DNA polymerase mu
MRLRAIDLGLYLGAHCFVARGDREGTTETKVVVDAQAGRPPEVITLGKLEPLPFKYVQSEEDILRVLACGTNAFAKLVDPTNRNA